MTLFDNGDTRISEFGGNSQGMVLNVNIPQRTVSSALTQNLGVYSIALGSAQALSNGNYMFFAGDVPVSQGTMAFSLEYSATGTPAYSERISSGAYRAFRVTDLYRPPNGGGVDTAQAGR